MPGGSKKGGGLETKSTYKESAMKVEADPTANRRDTGGLERGPFQMKYQGNSSAFPFKSPMKHDLPHNEPHGHAGDVIGSSKPGKVKPPKGGDEYGGK